MEELLPEEEQVFDLGKEVELPASIREGNFCFHRCVWFASGEIPNLPGGPSYNDHIRQYLDELKRRRVLCWENPLFEADTIEDLKKLECVRDLPKGVYLIHLLDMFLCSGHWAMLTETGIFEAGVGRKEIPVDSWICIFRNRYRVRRIFPISRT